MCLLEKLDALYICSIVTVYFKDIKVSTSQSLYQSIFNPNIKGYRLHCFQYATLPISFFWLGGVFCDYWHFLIWWRLPSFVMIIAAFWRVIGCKRSMDLDFASVAWAGQTAFPSLNEAFPLSTNSFYPYSLLALFTLQSHFINLLVYKPPPQVTADLACFFSGIENT